MSQTYPITETANPPADPSATPAPEPAAARPAVTNGSALQPQTPPPNLDEGPGDEAWSTVGSRPPMHGFSPGGSSLFQRLYDRIEAFVSRLSMRDNFWHSICSLIWLPLAFFSGIRMKQLDATTIAAYLPFRRFNRNWYRAMAGGALLANSEIAGGMYVFGVCGGDHVVVCKQLNYTFLRPCYGPAVYRMTPRENIRQLLGKRQEFNITIDLDVLQQASRFGERDKRVGRCEAVFHVTPNFVRKRRAARKRMSA
jgi:acyl-coenzyme A thioesterase PaaI-like protein